MIETNAPAALIVNTIFSSDGVFAEPASSPGGDVLKIRPPLPFGRAEADVFLAALDAVLADL